MDKDLERSIDRLYQQASSWRSIDLKTNEDFVNVSGETGPGAYQRATMKQDYIETALGQRFNRDIDLPIGMQETLAEYYCDGGKCADVQFTFGPDPKQKLIHIKKSFKYEAQNGCNLRPIPLRYLYYADVTPLHVALKDADPLGPCMHLGRPCDTFVLRQFARGNYKTDLVYTLDRETGLPLKLVFYCDPKGYAASPPSMRWEALGVETIQGHLFPMKSEEVLYVRSSDGKAPVGRDKSPQVICQSTYTVETLRFDGDYPASTFWPVVSPEASVMNSITNELVPPKVRPVVVKVANPIRAEVPSGWPEMLPGLGLGVGAVLLFVGLVAWWRGKSAPKPG